LFFVFVFILFLKKMEFPYDEYPEDDAAARGDGDGDAAGDKEEEEGPLWVPAMLESTREKVDELKRDAVACRHTSCLLCEIAIPENGCTGHMAEILAFERSQRRHMKPNILFEAICRMYNRDIIMRRRVIVGDKESREITLAEARSHFLGNHDRDWRRMMEDRLDYLGAAAEELEKIGLWQINERDPNSPIQPNGKNFGIYTSITTRMENIYQRLQGTPSTSKVGKGPNNHGKKQNGPRGRQ
jgi:hypothetical protein